MDDVLRSDASVLIAEDERLFAETYVRLVKSFRPDYAIHEARSGVDAIRVMTANRVDLMLMGLRMPRMNGFDVLEFLHDKNIRIPTVIITSLWYCFRELFQPSGLIIAREAPLHNNREYEILRQYRSMIFGFFPAPVNKDDLRNAIIRCEDYRDRQEQGNSIKVWQDLSMFT
jgi:hypothetical protein